MPSRMRVVMVATVMMMMVVTMMILMMKGILFATGCICDGAAALRAD